MFSLKLKISPPWCLCYSVKSLLQTFLAHLSRRLTGELIVYPCSGVRPASVVVHPSVRRPQFQRSSPLKPLGQSKPNFMWSILGKGSLGRGKESLYKWSRSHDQQKIAKTFKNLLLKNQWADFHETLYVASGTRAHHSLYKS